MITGRSGHKQVVRAEKIYCSEKISTVSVRRSAKRELNSAIKDTISSYTIGLKDFNRAINAVQKARTPSAKKKAKERFKEIDSRLKQLEARRTKATALLRKVEALK